jgi:hypothetical protein
LRAAVIQFVESGRPGPEPPAGAPPGIPAKRTIEPLPDALAGRIAGRDLPPVVVYSDPNDPEQFVQRLVEALRPWLLHGNERGRLGRARMLYCFMANETQTGAHLAAAAGVERGAGSRAHTALVQAGLLAWTRIGPRRVFRLTRWGEDWLLAVGRCEVPPGRVG